MRDKLALSSFLKLLVVFGIVLSTKAFSDPASVPSKESSKASAKDIVFYSAQWCGYCQKAKTFMIENAIEFTELDLDASDEHIEQFEAAGGTGIPYLVVGDKKLSGFDVDDYRKALNL